MGDSDNNGSSKKKAKKVVAEPGLSTRTKIYISVPLVLGFLTLSGGLITLITHWVQQGENTVILSISTALSAISLILLIVSIILIWINREGFAMIATFITFPFTLGVGISLIPPIVNRHRKDKSVALLITATSLIFTAFVFTFVGLMLGMAAGI